MRTWIQSTQLHTIQKPERDHTSHEDMLEEFSNNSRHQ